MTGHEFIFSTNRDIRLFRHLVFWVSCWLYISLSYYFIQQTWMLKGFDPKHVSPGYFILLKSALLILVYTIPCYVFINIIVPAFIRSEWLKIISIITPLIVLMYGLGWFMYWKLFPFIDVLLGLQGTANFPSKFWPAVVLGLIDPLKIITAAAIIKYIKHWWSQQKEKEQLEQEKLNAELQLLKAQVSPEFLFTALDNLYAYALAASPSAPKLLMKLSDLLSYMIYECDAKFVPLEKEIERMQDFIDLEKLRRQDNLELGLTIKGDLTGKMIAPFILVPFLEYGFKRSEVNIEQPWINLDFRVDKDMFVMTLISGLKSIEDVKLEEGKNTLLNVRKRLNLLYPQAHELKLSQESEMFIIRLKIKTTLKFDSKVNAFN